MTRRFLWACALSIATAWAVLLVVAATVTWHSAHVGDLRRRAADLERRVQELERRPTATVEWCDTFGPEASRTWEDLAPFGITPPPDVEKRPRAGRMRIW